MAATLADLILRVRQRCDMVNSTFINDTNEVTPWINESYSELYDILVSRFEDYYIQTTDFTLTGSNEQTLPAGYYKTRRLEFALNGLQYVPLDKWNFDEGDTINPTQQSVSGNYRHWWIPRFTPLAASGDVLGDVLDFEEYIIVDSAMKALDKEESDVTSLSNRKAYLKQRIEAMASNRDTRPDRIVDVKQMRWNNSLIGNGCRKYRVMGGNIIVVNTMNPLYALGWY